MPSSSNLTKYDLSVVEHFGLEQHPEGGWFKRTYSSRKLVNLKYGNRLCGTSIYYYLCEGESSSLHTLKSDETWYYHFGSPVVLHLFNNGVYDSVILGKNWEGGEVSQYTVMEGTAFGAELSSNSGTLMSCSVCPGFHQDDFHWANQADLLIKFPEQKEIIYRLTKNTGRQ
jgi:predicted cupin superfamily sugar epimerase